MSAVRKDMRTLYNAVMELTDIGLDISSVEDRGHRRGVLIQRVLNSHAKVDDIFPEDRVDRMQEVFQNIISISSQRFITEKSFACFLDFFVEVFYMGPKERGTLDESYWVETLSHYWAEGQKDAEC